MMICIYKRSIKPGKEKLMTFTSRFKTAAELLIMLYRDDYKAGRLGENYYFMTDHELDA